MSNSAIKDFSN